MTASADLMAERARVQRRLELNATQGAHSVLAGLVACQRRYIAALDADDYAASRHELNCLRVLVGSDEPDPTAPWWRSLRCLVIVACAALLASAVITAIGLRLRAADAEVQLEMCRRAR